MNITLANNKDSEVYVLDFDKDEGFKFKKGEMLSVYDSEGRETNFFCDYNNTWYKKIYTDDPWGRYIPDRYLDSYEGRFGIKRFRFKDGYDYKHGFGYLVECPYHVASYNQFEKFQDDYFEFGA